MSKWKNVRSDAVKTNELSHWLSSFLGKISGFFGASGFVKTRHSSSIILSPLSSVFLLVMAAKKPSDEIWWRRSKQGKENCIWWSCGIYHIILVELSYRPKSKRGGGTKTKKRFEIITKTLKLINKKLKFKQFIIKKSTTQLCRKTQQDNTNPPIRRFRPKRLKRIFR